MKSVLLLRHAKSSWKEDGVEDIERPLSKRGRQAAKVLARHLHDQKIAPEQILCSPAVRTRETLERIQPAFAAAMPIRFEKGIYMADAPVLLRRLRRLTDSLASVMVIGHNPGLQRFVLMLTDGSDDPRRREIAGKYPTAALAVIACDIEHWVDLKAGCGRIDVFLRPSDLQGE